MKQNHSVKLFLVAHFFFCVLVVALFQILEFSLSAFHPDTAGHRVFMVGQFAILYLLGLPVYYLLSKHSSERYLRNQIAESDKEGFLAILTKLIEEKDQALGAHGRRVAELVRLLCRDLRLAPHPTAEIIFAALYHDIGLAIHPSEGGNSHFYADGCRDSHPLHSEALLRPIHYYSGAAGIVRSHHERWDGKGYPDGLQGDAIPLGARLIAVADFFDTLTHGLGGESLHSEAEAWRKIEAQKGKMFDPAAVESFIDIIQVRLAASAQRKV